MIADNIKQLREAAGISQREMADRLGVSHGVIVNLEYGRLKDPEKKMPLLRLIAKEFKVPLEWILNGGELEIPDMTEAEKEARRMGELIKTKDPAVKSFIEFWSFLSKAERETLSKQIIEYARILEDNLKNE